VVRVSYLDNLNDVGWTAFCIGLYLFGLFVAVALCRGAAIADKASERDHECP